MSPLPPDPVVAAPEVEQVPAAAGPVGAPDVAAEPLSARGRYIVLLRDGSTSALASSLGRRWGFQPDRVFSRAVRGFSATLPDAVRDRLARDPDVAAVIPDEVIELAWVRPTGIRRVNAPSSPLADIDAIDDARVDADIAIVDTGIDRTHPDLDVVGGINCSTSDPNAWRDVHGHGTHVAGTAAAIDKSSGVVGVAPGARLWAVKILNDQGDGLLSWYVCGLDWIAAQRDPSDPDRPLFEAVNMSVTKSGSDDQACGDRNGDILHQAICRLVGSGVTVVAAAANDSKDAALRVPASYDEVITVSALADMDGLPGGKGPQLCGSYDADDTFADFSNYGADVDIIAPGKCIWSTLRGNRYGYSSGTSMAAPHVTGAVALYKASRPEATPAEIKEALRFLGTSDWKTWTDPDPWHEPLLDVSRLGPLGSFSMAVLPESSGTGGDDSAETTVTATVALVRSTTFFEPVSLAAETPDGITATFDKPRLMGFGVTGTTMTLTAAPGIDPAEIPVTIRATYKDIVRTTTLTLDVEPAAVRLAGADRYATAAAISAASFGPGVAVAYVATGANFPDALAGSAAAGSAGAPVLLVTRDTIPTATATELGRLKPGRIVVLGGASVVTDAVKAALARYTAGSVSRLAGADRYATAAAISAASFGPGVAVAYVATGANFPDALAGSAAAGSAGAPVLLVTRDTIPTATATELGRLKPARIVVLGGASVVTDAVKAALARYTAGSVSRLAGADRYATAAAISAASFGPGVAVAYVATGANFPDALAGSAAAGSAGAPVLLVTRDTIPTATATELGRLKPARIVVLGGDRRRDRRGQGGPRAVHQAVGLAGPLSRPPRASPGRQSAGPCPRARAALA